MKLGVSTSLFVLGSIAPPVLLLTFGSAELSVFRFNNIDLASTDFEPITFLIGN